MVRLFRSVELNLLGQSILYGGEHPHPDIGRNDYPSFLWLGYTEVLDSQLNDGSHHGPSAAVLTTCVNQCRGWRDLPAGVYAAEF